MLILMMLLIMMLLLDPVLISPPPPSSSSQPGPPSPPTGSAPESASCGSIKSMQCEQKFSTHVKVWHSWLSSASASASAHPPPSASGCQPAWSHLSSGSQPRPPSSHSRSPQTHPIRSAKLKFLPMDSLSRIGSKNCGSKGSPIHPHLQSFQTYPNQRRLCTLIAPLAYFFLINGAPQKNKEKVKVFS